MPDKNNFLFTLNNYTNDDIRRINNFFADRDTPHLVKCCRMGLEVAKTTGTPHFQGYISFIERISKKACIKVFENIFRHNRTSVRFMKGKFVSVCTYNKKEENVIIFWGDLPEINTEAANEANKERWKHMISLAREYKFDEIEDLYPYHWMQSKNKILDIAFQKTKPLAELPMAEFHFGKSGLGKTTTVLNENPLAYDKTSKNKWWDNYNGQETVIINDLEPKDISNIDFKNLIEKKPLQVEIKGGSIKIRPKKIVVTSNYTIDELFPQSEPIKRRFDTIEYQEDPLQTGEITQYIKKRKLNNKNFNYKKVLLEN